MIVSRIIEKDETDLKQERKVKNRKSILKNVSNNQTGSKNDFGIEKFTTTIECS